MKTFNGSDVMAQYQDVVLQLKLNLTFFRESQTMVMLP